MFDHTNIKTSMMIEWVLNIFNILPVENNTRISSIFTLSFMIVCLYDGAAKVIPTDKQGTLL